MKWLMLLHGNINLLIYSAFGLFNGLNCGNIQCLNGREIFKQPSAKKMRFSINDCLNLRSSLLSGESNLLHHSASSNVASNALIGDRRGGVEVQSESVKLGADDMVPFASGFPVENDSFDLDLPSEGFSSIPEAIEDIYKGKVGLHVTNIFEG